MYAPRHASIRQAAAALALAATVTVALLGAMGLLADRSYADEALAQGCGPASQQVVVAAAQPRS